MNIGMAKASFFCVSIFIGLFFSCSNIEQKTLKHEPIITLITENETLHYIQIKTDSSSDRWELPYPIYQFQIGDIDNNGIDDIMVGVIKTTHFDTVKGKRLFIFKNYNGLVRPLWLGSSLGKPLVDFTFISNNNENKIRSIEREKSGKYLVAEYRWKKFGFKFIHYLNREIELKQAFKQLKE